MFPCNNLFREFYVSKKSGASLSFKSFNEFVDDKLYSCNEALKVCSLLFEGKVPMIDPVA